MDLDEFCSALLAMKAPLCKYDMTDFCKNGDLVERHPHLLNSKTVVSQKEEDAQSKNMKGSLHIMTI